MKKLFRNSVGFWFINKKGNLVFTRYKIRGVDNFSCFFCHMCFATRRGLQQHSADLKSDCYKTALQIICK